MRNLVFLQPFLGIETWFFFFIVHTNIYFTETLFFLNLDNLEAAPGRPAPESQIKTLKKMKFSYEITFCSVKYIKIIFHTIEAIWKTPRIYLKAAGGWSWRPARYRYGGQTLVCLHVCLIIGLLGSGIQFFHQK